MNSATHQRRRIILFDAVGTLMQPKPSVASAYRTVGSRHGSQLLDDEIAKRFGRAFQKHFASTNHHYSRPTNETVEQGRWQLVVQSVFESDYSSDLFEDLWDHFAQPRNWELFPGVRECLSHLTKMKMELGVASNFDKRLLPLVNHLLPEIRPDFIFASTEVGYSKPDVRFYKQIEKRLARHFARPDLLMIGDSWILDVESARRAGWGSIWKSDETLPDVATIAAYFLRNT